MDRPSSRQTRQENTGSPAADIGTFFQEPTTSSSSRPKSHHVEPFNTPARSIHATHHKGSSLSNVYKHPTQHRPVHRHHNAPIGTPEMNLDAVFKEPAWYTSSTTPGSKMNKKALKNQGGARSHHVDPFNAPAHPIHPVVSHHASHRDPHLHEHEREHEHEHEEGYYMNHQPIHGRLQHTSSAVYKHPTQHRPVHRPHNAPVRTPEMHLDAFFQEPAWYTTTGAKGKSQKAIKKAATKAPTREQQLGSQHIDPSKASAHLIHPVASHAHSSQHHVDEEDYYMNHQPIHGHRLSHHDIKMFSIPSRHSDHSSSDTSSHRLYASMASSESDKTKSHTSHHEDHNEEGYYTNHQPIHGDSRHDSTHGALYKHPTQHRAVHRHHNAPIGTPEMHLESVFREPKAIPIRSAPHDFCHKDCVDSDDYEIGYQHILGHHSPQERSLDLSHWSHENDDHNEEGYYKNHQSIYGDSHPQHHDWDLGPAYKYWTLHHAAHHHNSASIETPEMDLDAVFKEPSGYTSSGLSVKKGSEALKKQSSVHGHGDEEGYHMNHQPTSGHNHDWHAHAGPSHAYATRPQREDDVWNLGSLLDDTPSWAMNARPLTRKQQKKAEDSTVWNLGTLLDETPSWAMNARPVTRKQQKKAEDSTTWNLGSLFDDTTPARTSKASSHATNPSTSWFSSTSRQQSRPLTVDEIARVSTPIGQTVTYTTVTRTTVTLMGVPSSLGHDMQHVQAERGHVLTDFSGPVSRAGQTSIWVRKESSEEMFEGDHVVCQNCRRSLSHL